MMTSEEFNEHVQPLLTDLREVQQPEFAAYLDQSPRFALSVREVEGQGNWWLYWRGPDQLAAARLDSVAADGAVQASTKCFIPS